MLKAHVFHPIRIWIRSLYLSDGSYLIRAVVTRMFSAANAETSSLAAFLVVSPDSTSSCGYAALRSVWHVGSRRCSRLLRLLAMADSWHDPGSYDDDPASLKNAHARIEVAFS